MSEIYDAVIVGAGCAGSVFSARLASRGFRVLLVERKREDDIGRDSFGFVENEGFDLAAIKPSAPPEEYGKINCVEVYAPDGSKSFTQEDFSCRVVDRRLLGKRLLEIAKEAGVELITQCVATGVVIENGFAVAIETDRGVFKGRLIVGASGLDRVVCRDLPKGMGIPRALRTADHVCVYSETRKIDPEFAMKSDRTGVLKYYVGRYGGYQWVLRIDGDMVDIGSAVQDRKGVPDSGDLVHGFLRSNPWVGEEVVKKSGGRIPTRRPLNTMVASGLMVLGDSACQAMPIVGRGVGGAMIGACFASDAASFALETGDLTPAGLWSYNSNFMRNRGADMAALDCIRVFLQKLDEKEFVWAISKGVISRDSIASVIAGRMPPGKVPDKVRRILKGLGDVSLVSRFDSMSRLAQKIYELYSQYPKDYDHPEFVEWSSEVDYLFEDVYSL
ncbi:MAG: NAD(P)/FAD-dependent oxidoreductase [Actinomycetota bacterium]|nr:NAD(P)/FAD-dependent oxidoreductase [Actinomycetota bacterium]